MRSLPWVFFAMAALALGCGDPAPAPRAAPPPATAGDDRSPALRCEAPPAGTSVEALRARLAPLPECAPLRFALAGALADEGRCDEADAALEALARAPATEERGRIALVRLAAGECGDRRRRALVGPLCETLLADPDGAAEAWVACGRLEEALGEHARAMERYARAHERDPALLEALEAPATLALRFRDFPGAARFFAALVAAAPERATAWRGLAMARRGLDDLPGAIAAMRRAVALDGSAPEPRYYLALWLRESGELAPAVAQLRAFLVVAADDPELEAARSEARATLERWRHGP